MKPLIGHTVSKPTWQQNVQLLTLQTIFVQFKVQFLTSAYTAAVIIYPAHCAQYI